MDMICDELDDFYNNFMKDSIRMAFLQSNPQKCFFNTQNHLFGIEDVKEQDKYHRTEPGNKCF